ncbi:uncharacterized protein K02A2.6-like isoform X2 [Neocloeon triangulifer]|uniref:uncharacterized protein K02A2.6-like isoform X2 n=1 Tax=Neocloeon triangulifer TaxID=2078957 RepID=UPI00286F0EA8|nr:uncharacterized protein K02A2.6-like isoform X2 [Neocloeon triangulifer]
MADSPEETSFIDLSETCPSPLFLDVAEDSSPGNSLENIVEEEVEGEELNETVSQHSKMTPQRPRIEPYDPKGGLTFDEYTDRWDLYFEDQGIEDVTKQRNAFLTNMDSKTYTLIINLLKPKKQAEPTKSVQRDRFHARVQQPGEPAIEFITELSRLADKAQFKERDEAMVARMISGLRDLKLKESLLLEPDDKLTVEYVSTRIYAHERAEAAAKELSGGQKGSLHQVVQKKAPDKDRQPNWKRTKGGLLGHYEEMQKNNQCFCCGKTSHMRDDCKLKKKLCQFCGRIGHQEDVCYTKKLKQKSKTTHHLDNEENSSEESSSEEDEGAKGGARRQEEAVTNYLLKMETKCEKLSSKRIFLDIQLNGQTLPMELDTGASYSLIGGQTFSEYFPKGAQLQPSNVKMKPWGDGPEIRAAGALFVPIWLQGREEPVQLELLVMEQPGPALIGRNWFEELGVEMKIPRVIARENVKAEKVKKKKKKKRKKKHSASVFKMENIPEEFQDLSEVFSPGLGRFKGPPVRIELKDGAKPIQRNARQVPFALVEKTEKALIELEEAGVIEQTLSSDWATPIVVVEKGDKVRICADYSSTVNPQIKRSDYPLPTLDQLLSKVKKGFHFTKIDLAEAYLQFEVDEESSEILTITTQRGRFKFRRMPPELEYLGYLFTQEGVKPTNEKIKAIQDMPAPKNLDELRAYLGLLKKGARFYWSTECQTAMEEAKRIVSKQAALAYFDPSKDVILACDGSNKGIGAVLSQVEQGKEIDVEALSIVWAVKKLKKFLWGRQFTIITDHRPLLGIFSPGKPLSDHLPAKLKRLPLEVVEEDQDELFCEEAKICFMDLLNPTLTVDRFKEEAKVDEELSAIKPLLLQEKAVVPQSLREKILCLLHSNHFGEVRTKSLARQYFWWPEMDLEISNLCAACEPCRLFNKAPNKAPIIPWGKTFIIGVDGLSGWMDCERTRGMSADDVILFCRKNFRFQGLCDVIVADNGPAFSPASNGVAEKGVQTVKAFLKKVSGDEKKLDSFLLGQNSCPNPTTGIAAAEFNLGRRPQTVIDKVHPDQQHIRRQIEREKRAIAAVTTKPRGGVEGQEVAFRQFTGRDKWVPGQAVRLLGPRRVRVKDGEGIERERHLDQVKFQPPLRRSSRVRKKLNQT